MQIAINFNNQRHPIDNKPLNHRPAGQIPSVYLSFAQTLVIT